jgi:hypothetical protein
MFFVLISIVNSVLNSTFIVIQQYSWYFLFMYFRLKHHYQIKVITFDVVIIAIIPKTLFTIFSDQISLQYTRIGLTHVWKSLRWVEILDFSDIKSCLIQNKDLVAFLHNNSTAFVKIQEGFVLHSKINSIILIEKTFSGQLSASFIKDHTLCFV